MTYSVLIADDHPVVLGGLAALIGEGSTFRVVATASDGAAALAELRRATPDIAVLDLNMPLQNGLDVVRRAVELKLRTPIVILAAAASDADIFALVTSGVAGIVFKDAAPQVRGPVSRASSAAGAGFLTMPLRRYSASRPRISWRSRASRR